jgi:ABC-2 type transport system permease protein
MGVVGPLVLGGVLALAFTGSGPGFDIALVDLDRSAVSEGIAGGLLDALGPGALDGDSAVTLHRQPDVDSMEGVRSEVDHGDVAAAIVLPAGYGASVVDHPEALVVIGSAENSVASSVAEGIARSVAARTDLRRAMTLGFVTTGLDPSTVSTDELQQVVQVESSSFTNDFDAPMFLGPMAVFLFLGLSVNAKSLVRDESDGILDRVRASPLSTGDVVAGAAISVMVSGILAASLVTVLSTVIFGASWGSPLDVAVIMVAFVAAVAGLLGLVVGVARTEAQADSWTNLLAFGFAILGGSFFGGASLPGVLGVVGTLTPNGAAMRALIEAGPGGEGIAGVWYLLLWMFAIGFVGVAVGGGLLKRRLR